MMGQLLYGVPKCISGFKDLKYLRGNLSFSDSIYNLDGTSIKEIEVFGKGIKNLDGLYGVKGLEKLELLESDIEMFSGFPDNLGTLKKLKIRTSQGIYRTSPMKATRNLQYLELDGVSTRNIKDLGHMPNLRRLKLDKTWQSSHTGEIEDITGVEKYQKLVELNLGSNDVKEGLDGIFKLPSLTKLTITKQLKSDKRFSNMKNAKGDLVEINWR
jgi:Leucine-rich repeat (LRR) protein